MSKIDQYSIIYFDGVCNLCNASVDFIIKRDSKKQFRYASLQSEAGQKILADNQFNKDDYDSFILHHKGKTYIKSTAALKVALIIGFPLNLMGIFLIIPPIVRNWVYEWIAANRYKWFGKKETCRLPSKEERALFL
jgi:predicted DCC family thiol-disulfide oxidoreductase YuxK